jgi:hypothetical protein
MIFFASPTTQAIPTSIMMNELVTVTVTDEHAPLFSPSAEHDRVPQNAASKV